MNNIDLTLLLVVVLFLFYLFQIFKEVVMFKMRIFWIYYANNLIFFISIFILLFTNKFSKWWLCIIPFGIINLYYEYKKIKLFDKQYKLNEVIKIVLWYIFSIVLIIILT